MEETKTVSVDGQQVDLLPACAALDGWDGRADIDATGAVLWREFINAFADNPFDVTTVNGVLYSTQFDPADPVGTPNTLSDNEAVMTSLGKAVLSMQSQGWPLDIALGDVQRDGRNLSGASLPLPGGVELEGAVSIVDWGGEALSSSTGPAGEPGDLVPGRSYRSIGYPVSFGNSFVMTLAFTADGPDAEALLAYGQSDDPTSPDFTAQTELLSKQQFRPVRFAKADVSLHAVDDVTVRGALAR